MQEIETSHFVRNPFAVEAFVITEENIDIIGPKIGEVKFDKKLGEKYILIDKRSVPNVSRAGLGWYVTFYKDNYKCYAPSVFHDQFIAVPDTGVAAFAFDENGDASYIVPVEKVSLEVAEPEMVVLGED